MNRMSFIKSSSLKLPDSQFTKFCYLSSKIMSNQAVVPSSLLCTCPARAFRGDVVAGQSVWPPGGGWFYGRNACNAKALAQIMQM